MSLNWTDEKTIVAILNYARIIVGVALAGILLYMFAKHQIDLDAVIKAILSLITIDRIAQGMTGAIKLKGNNGH